MNIQTINPASGEVLNNYSPLNESEILNRIDASNNAYISWRRTSFPTRKKLMQQLAQLLKTKKDELSSLITQEMGKPLSAAKSEIDKCALLCEHYAEHAEHYLADKLIQTEMKKAKVCYRPLGIIFGIMPWNFPFWQVFRFAVPTIMAGNAAILKHAPITTGTGNKIEDLFIEAGFPNDLFQHFIVDNAQAATIIAHKYIAAVTLTGSERAGSSVAAQAGKFLKKSVLELGGCDPYIVLEDADVDKAARSIVTSRLSNAGQVCIAAKRVIAQESIKEELLKTIKHHMSAYIMGDPLDPTVKLGPMARQDLRDTLQTQVEKSMKQGAKLLCGGIIPDGKGFFYPPTLLSNVRPGMPAFDEELFGPVIAITTVDSEVDAIAYANNSQYGLGAAIFTKNIEKGEYLATYEVEAGTCYVNSFVASDPRLPFGGIKHSGYGRELSKEGILEFVNTKTIVVSD